MEHIAQRTIPRNPVEHVHRKARNGGRSFANGAMLAASQFLFGKAIQEQGKNAKERVRSELKTHSIEFIRNPAIRTAIETREEVVATADFARAVHTA